MDLKTTLELMGETYKVVDRPGYEDVVHETNDLKEAKRQARARPYSAVVRKKPTKPDAWKTITRKKDLIKNHDLED